MEASGDQGHSQSADHSTGKKTPAQILEDKKTKLRKDIQELEKLNFQIRCNLNITKFGDIKHLLTTPEPDPTESSKRIPDVETEYMDLLFQLAGMHCTKFDENEYVFSFGVLDNNISVDTYAVQIVNVSKDPKVGKYVMPDGVDMDRILLETPLVNATDLKPFLANCKHRIDCYINRVKQYNELQLIVNELFGCWLDFYWGYTTIILKLFDMEDQDSGELHNVVLYLIYESNRARPHKMKIEGVYAKQLPDDLVDKLQSYFKHFKCFDLKKAFEETVYAKDTPVVWRREEDQDMDLDTSNASSSEASGPSQRGKKKKKPSNGGKKRKIAETFTRAHRSLSQEQDSDDSQRMDDPPLSLSETTTERGKKSVGKKGKGSVPKNKRNKTAGAAAKPGILKKGSKAKKNRQKNVKPSVTESEKNLRQSTLAFQFEKPGEVDRTRSNNDDDTPLSARISSAGTSTAHLKSRSNIPLLGKGELQTSTPVSNLNWRKKRFGVDNTADVSPIKSKSDTTLKGN